MKTFWKFVISICRFYDNLVGTYKLFKEKSEDNRGEKITIICWNRMYYRAFNIVKLKIQGVEYANVYLQEN